MLCSTKDKNQLSLPLALGAPMALLIKSVHRNDVNKTSNIIIKTI